MKDLTFNGQGGDGYSRSSKVTNTQTNTWSGHLNDGRLVNKGRGPTKGNQDYNAMQGSHREPPASQRDSVTFPKNMDSINVGSQVRNPGGTKEMPKLGKETFNFGRGPTKGNSQ